MNERTKQPGWTPRRLLSLLMALVMTLSLLPTAALADDPQSAVGSPASPIVFSPDKAITSGNGTQYYCYEPTEYNSVINTSSIGSDIKTALFPIVTVESYDAAKSTSHQCDTDFNLKLSFGAKYLGSSRDYEQYAIRISQVDASGNTIRDLTPGDPKLRTQFKLEAGAEPKVSDDSIDAALTVPEDGVIRLKYEFCYAVAGGLLVNITPSHELYVNITGIPVSGIQYNVTYRNAYVSSDTDKTDQTGADGKATYTVRDYAPTRNQHTFSGWKVSGNCDQNDTKVQAGAQLTGITGDIDLMAEFDMNYKVSYASQLQGASGLPWPSEREDSEGTKYTIPYTPAMYGFTFTGWKVSKDGGSLNTTVTQGPDGKWVVNGIDADIILIAQWSNGTTPVGSHTISFFGGAADAYIPFSTTAAVADGAAYTIPGSTPTRLDDTYTFDGWIDEQGNTYDPGEEITDVKSDISLYAVWSKKQVNVTYGDAKGGVQYVSKPANGLVNMGSEHSFRLQLTDGYDPATLHVYANVNANEMELAASATSSSGVYLYRFRADADTSITISAPSLKQYTVTLPTGERVDAAFTGDDTKIKTVSHGGEVSFTVTPREGWTLKNVYDNGAPITANNGVYTISDIACDHEIKADVEQTIFYSVTYAVPGFSSWQQSYESGTELYPADSTKPGVTKLASMAAPTGYEWDWEWYTDAACTDKITDDKPLKVNGDTTVYAKYEPQEIEIRYISNGTTATSSGTEIPSTPKTYGYGAQLTTSTPDGEEGYTFLGWSENPNAAAPAYKSGEMYNVNTTESVDLYAVWQKNVYTITLPTAGTGYSISYSQSTSVAHGEDFEFTITVDGDYAANVPTVSISDPAHGKLEFSGSGNYLHQPGVYHCKIVKVTGNQIVSVSATENERVKVTFSYRVVDKDGNELLRDALSGSVYSYQSVQIGDPASQPELPKLEGYRFVRWSVEQEAEGVISYPAYTFVDPVMGPMTVYAEMTPITPVVTWPAANEQIGYKIIFINPASLRNVSGNSGTVAYNDTVRFYVMIETGYDASNIQVGINGQLYTPVSTDGNVYTYEFSAKEDLNKITVVDIGRKDVKVTYYANATDDVEHIPGQQILKYYLPNAADNGTLDKATPKRVGYEFQGWSTDPETDPDAAGAKLYQPGEGHDFVTDTNLYAIWKATSTTVKLEVSGLRKDSAGNEGQYEGKSITLTAEIEKTGLGTPGGSMRFYKKTLDGKTILIETVPVTGSTVTLTTAAGEFINKPDWSESYWVEYFPEEGKGFATSTSDPVSVRVWSTAISWALTGAGKIVDGGDVLTIYENSKAGSDNAPGSKVADGKMVAGNVYWLEIPTVCALNGGDDPTAGHGYAVKWEYMDDNGSWREYSTVKDSDLVMIDAAHSRFSFRANVIPSDPFTKAVDYDANSGLIDHQYNTAGLYTKQTEYVALEKTATALTITAEDESNSVLINGDTPFAAIGDANGTHKAQFENQEITLTARVTVGSTTDGVATGSVEFYRYAGMDGSTEKWDLISTVPVETAGVNAGTASTSFTMPAYDKDLSAYDNQVTFKAVYVENATYASSLDIGERAFVKSASIKTPIIQSALPNKDGETATTYLNDLTGLLAGVKHTFTLRDTGAAATADSQYSVVALDGRTVDADYYEIEWQYTTGEDFSKADNDSGAKVYTTTTAKTGNQYRVKLIGKQNTPFSGSWALSMAAVIDTKQDVTLTVEASDAISATPVDRDAKQYPDVYQLNPITLTATVEGFESQIMAPTGTVKFYYKDKQVDPAAFVCLGEATLEKGTDGKMHASIETSELPVDKDGNTRLNVVVCAAYFGDETFAPSRNVNKEGVISSAGYTAANSTRYVGYDTVTVYSSVVFSCADENKAVENLCTDRGVHISVFDGAFKANDRAVLKLSDVYTLDRGLSGELLDTIAKLNPNTDYTIRWEELKGATAIKNGNYADSKNWKTIDGQSGTTLILEDVAQDTAYRAVITVKDTAIAKGSYEKVKQAVEGRQVYYSNVLMPTDGSMTVSVAINTSATKATTGKDNYEGITEGETVTANVFTSGAVGATPNAEITVVVTNDASRGNGSEGDYSSTLTVKNTVNGWNAFDWDTTGVAPGFYTMTVTATSNIGYEPKTIKRSLIVRESSYTIVPESTAVVYNGRTQGLDVTLEGFDFHGNAVNEAAQKSWTVKYYVQNVEGLETGALVEPTQAGTYRAVITLPASAYWTEQTVETIFTIRQRSVSINDAVAQAKVYDNSTNVNIVEVMLKDAVTAQTSTGWLEPSENTGVINGDSIYAVATAAALEKKDAGSNRFTVSKIRLCGDDAANYVWDETPYSESIYVSRSQVYGETGTLTLKQGEAFPAEQVISMIDQSGREIQPGTGSEDYTLTFYYHSDTKIEKTTDLSKPGLYTVVARPNQSNFKGGVTMKFRVADGDTVYTPAADPQPSTLISISNTAELYGSANGVEVSFTNGATLSAVEYLGKPGKKASELDAGRYIVKVTASTGDVAYGIYTIAKAHPDLGVTPASSLVYNSLQQDGYTALSGNAGSPNADWYVTYAGDVAIGYNKPAEGNVDENAPVDAGTYTVTLHVNETTNYTSHELSESFTIAKAPLNIKADSWKTMQYGAFPDMTATYDGLVTADTDAPDTSLRDVQIAPEFLYNPKDGMSNYSNFSLDHVGLIAIQPLDALSKNYKLSYENGQYAKNDTANNPDLAIHGLPQSGTGASIVYFGDVVQLYPYGYYSDLSNGSSVLEWSVSDTSIATIDKHLGILTITGVGDFTVTLTRGIGELQISKTVSVTALKKELKVHLPDQDKVYSGTIQTYSDTVFAYDELFAKIAAATTTPANNERAGIGTQITTSRVATGSKLYQSLVYGGKFTINDKDATVAPGAQSTVYGTLERFVTNPKYTTAGAVASIEPVTDVNVASQTDAYDRLDVYNGYEILVAGTENMNYNVTYTTDDTAEDSEVTIYGGVKFYSTTTKAQNELNDATVYGEQTNDLDWILEDVRSTTRGGATYSDNLADFNLPEIFVRQDKDDCIDNKVTYKAANREEGNTSRTALAADRTATNKLANDNYELVFGGIVNAKAENYTLVNSETMNGNGTMTDPTGNIGFIGAASTSDNLIEGSANIAQRPITLEKAVADAKLYWRLPQSQLYTALINILKAEKNSVGRGLAKGHTIEDLDLSFTINGLPVDPESNDALNLPDGSVTVIATVGDTNYKLEGGQFQFDIVLKKIQIEATYTTKTFTGFTVLIKVHNEDLTTSPLTDSKGLSYKIFKKTADGIDKSTAYAEGTLTYQNRTAYDDKGDLCGVFTTTYQQLPLLSSGETYFIQMYEYGVELKTNS